MEDRFMRPSSFNLLIGRFHGIAHAQRRRFALRPDLLIAVGLLLWGFAAAAGACPFCAALEPTLSSRRERAEVVVLGEVLAHDQRQATIGLRQTLKGAALLAGKQSFVVPAAGLKTGRLALLFGEAQKENEEAIHYVADPVDETSYAYFARSPDQRKAASVRLSYFARFLENSDPWIAGDAYQEFAHAPLADVRSIADALPGKKIPAWLLDERVPPARKGFYALALTLDPDAKLRTAHAELLERLILAPDDDFRAGFDGIIGGYLLLRGEPGLELIEQRYFADPRAADGDVRHALSAVRFYHEQKSQVSRERLARAIRPLLARPEFAAPAITDLARWQDWSATDEIAALYGREAYASPATARAIVGYLRACPLPAASAALDRLRALDPPGLAAAEQSLDSPAGARQ